MEQPISDGADIWLRMLDREFECELLNHNIGSEHVKYATASDARMAMLRQAYQRGVEDATAPAPTTFEEDAARVEAVNNSAKR